MIELKPLSLDHVNLHFQWNNDEELNFYDSDHPHHEESFDSFLMRVKKMADVSNTTTKVFEIHDSQNGRMIGVVDIHHIDQDNKKCSVECTIGNKSYRNQGYGKSAMIAALQYCFEVLKLNKVSTTSFDFNDKWIHLVGKLGFTKEGELRNHALKRGRYSSKYIFSMLKNEYEALIESEEFQKEYI